MRNNFLTDYFSFHYIYNYMKTPQEQLLASTYSRLLLTKIGHYTLKTLICIILYQ